MTAQDVDRAGAVLYAGMCPRRDLHPHGPKTTVVTARWSAGFATRAGQRRGLVGVVDETGTYQAPQTDTYGRMRVGYLAAIRDYRRATSTSPTRS